MPRPSVGRCSALTAPGARPSVHGNISHAPSWDDAPGFDREPAR